ncbi:SWI/SNF-related matrix-associated actin-dependent regulator of chromatin subfamily A containing DEAD/H box 1 homolog [Bicyclus anynana]|uniref:SWI/SNF-related matrix-associated actin-dependent regulator of chromatin subfamily A containing DEAD/H box 1 homolog n=1 Tax=Bicyclus anynana TaxID=110368 RepID=A0ABM3LR96_BICAN|nr:SWI/SNF-related matrix-associated actin-dependent regulator of chromatin subfamily A containing DEAD/H box 1 homolog [Bicyclus anynana]
MSESTSPSVLSYLRQYRFQKKPTPGSSTSLTVTSSPSSSQHLIRMPAPALPNSKSAPIVYKRIRILDSDSDDSSPAKKPAQVVELTTAVKERRFRNMMEMFPDISPLFVKSTLVKHGWNEERSRDELLKHDPESESNNTAVSKPGLSRPGFSGQLARPSNGMSAVRVTSGPSVPSTVVRKPLAAKGGRARRGSSGSEDDDYGVRKGKDDRVYDSDDSDNEVTDDLIGDKKKVYEFLNTSTLNELTQLSGCSQKKAEAIMSQRPFNGWLDMVEKFNSNKMLSTELLNSTQELLCTRNNIQRLMKKCVGLAQQLEAAVAAGAGRLRQPASLSTSLKLAPYQLVGLNWLAVLHKQGVSGILADEMGLGKTVQVIAFLAHLKETGQARGTHLIVVPASTLDNWSSELARWCPALRVSKYYGNPEERRQLRIEYSRGLEKIDIVLTTYTMVSSCPEERKMFRITPLHYVVYDEAHMLKNMSTQRYDNLLKIKSKHRLLLTGTPLQNNLIELMSLLCFVMPHMFSGKTDDLKNLFQKNSKAKTTKKAEGNAEDDVPAFEQSQITQAKRIMKPFVLRRLKNDVLQDLPKKTNHTILCPMSEKQQRQYKELIAGFSAKDGTVSLLFISKNNMLQDLPKKTNHTILCPMSEKQQRQYKELIAGFSAKDGTVSLLFISKNNMLQDLPKKTNHTILCPMSEKQQRQYKELIAGFSAKDGTIHSTVEQNGISMMMEMRKLANHPLLLRFFYDQNTTRKIATRLAKDPNYKEKNEQYVFEDLMCLSDFQMHQLTQQYHSINGYAIPDPLIEDSGKFSKLDEMLPKLKEEGHRVLIFSQFTMMLDIFEPYMQLRNYRYLRLDGSTAVNDRQELIDIYNTEDVFVFLLSTKAGGLGINLTAADTVIIHDIDFNPYNDKQAEDRCHRMGQVRPVTIYRLLSAGTIEEGIYQVAQEKLNLEKHVTGVDENEPTEQKNVVRLLSSALGLSTPSK